MHLDTILAPLIQKEISDIHFKVGSPPLARTAGELKPVSGWSKNYLQRIPKESLLAF